MTKEEIKNIICEKQFLIDNEWLDKYCELLANNISCKRIKNITQCHHIIPKYYFKHRNIEVDDSNNNLIHLQYKDHVLAHYYLANCSINILDRYSNITFLNFALNTKNIDIELLNLDDAVLKELQSVYIEVTALNQQLRHEKYVAKKQKELEIWVSEKHECKRCGKVMTEKYGRGEYCCKKCAVTHNHTEETRKLISDMNKSGICGNKGKHLSKEHREKISLANMGKTFSEESRRKNSEKHKGRIPWNKGLTKEDPRVAKSIENRSNTMMKKYNTLNVYEVHKIKESD